MSKISTNNDRDLLEKIFLNYFRSKLKYLSEKKNFGDMSFFRFF